MLKGIKSLLYNDGYTIRGVQKVIRENGTKKILLKELQNISFTDESNNNTENENKISQHSLGETKRKKLMNVLNDLVELRKKLDND